MVPGLIAGGTTVRPVAGGGYPWTAPRGNPPPPPDMGPVHHTLPGGMCGEGGIPLAFMQDDFLVLNMKTERLSKARASWVAQLY